MINNTPLGDFLMEVANFQKKKAWPESHDESTGSFRHAKAFKCVWDDETISEWSIFHHLNNLCGFLCANLVLSFPIK